MYMYMYHPVQCLVLYNVVSVLHEEDTVARGDLARDPYWILYFSPGDPLN